MTIHFNSNEVVFTLWKGIHHDKTSKIDQFTSSSGQDRLGRCSKSTAEVLGNQIASRFYTVAVDSHSCVASVLQNRLQGYSTTALRLARSSQEVGPCKGATLYHNPKGPAAAAKKRAWHRLQKALFDHAKATGLTPTTEASIDSTGLESRFVSRHFLMRQGKRTSKYRRWTKLTIVADNGTHLIAAADVSLGPSNDSPLLPEPVRKAIEHIPIKRLLADAGYDAETNHEFCRNELEIPSTIIPVNERNLKYSKVKGRYRSQMSRYFPKRKFGNRWQIESIFSRFKRKLGYALRAVTEQARETECFIKVLTYNLMVVLFTCKWFLQSILIFYF
jgi:hypothetical protein